MKNSKIWSRNAACKFNSLSIPILAFFDFDLLGPHFGHFSKPHFQKISLIIFLIFLKNFFWKKNRWKVSKFNYLSNGGFRLKIARFFFELWPFLWRHFSNFGAKSVKVQLPLHIPIGYQCIRVYGTSTSHFGSFKVRSHYTTNCHFSK